MVNITEIEQKMLDRFTPAQVQEFNNWQLTLYLKEHNKEFSEFLRKL